MRMRALGLCLLIAGVGGCGDDSGGASVSASDAGPRTVAHYECADGDEDGFGEHCDAGRDCDDEDPEITNECLACLVPTNEGCPCEPNTRPISCVPPRIHTANGYWECEEGSRFCRDGAWSACEAVGDYVFVSTGM